MACEGFQVLGPLLGRGRIATRRPTKRSIEMVFRQLYLCRYSPKQRRGFRCSSHGRCAVAGVNAGLQLANPIAGCSNSKTGIVIQMLLEAALVELRIIEGVEVRCKSTEHPDESVLRCNEVADKTEPHLPHEFKRVLDRVLDFTERISRGEKIRIQVGAGIGCISKIAGVLRRIESAPQENAAGRQVLGPVRDMDGENQVDAGAKAVKPALFDQIQAKLAEAESCLVVSKVRPEDAAQPHIGET